MRHFPIFVNMDSARVLLSGGGEAALAKLRLLLKSSARIEVFAPAPAAEILDWAAAGRLTLHRRALRDTDVPGATLVYAADEDDALDGEVARLARAGGALINIVDNLEDSAFITPAMVDRDPVCIAIGTEGAAPMLARSIKAGLEAQLPAALGTLTCAAQAFRPAAEALPHGRARRAFWAEYFDRTGPDAFAQGGAAALHPALTRLLARHRVARPESGQVTLTWTGSDDPELMTLKARKALDSADVVIHDAAIAPAVLELARREAQFIALDAPSDVPPMPQLLARHAAGGAHVIYLSADPLPARLADGCRAAGATVIEIPGLPGIPTPSDLKETA